HALHLVAMGAEATRPVMRAATGFDADAHRGQLGDTGHQVVPGQALAIHDFTCVIHAYRVKHALGDIDPEDVYLVLHGTRLLWLNRFTDRERIVAHCRRSAQGRVHFITTNRFGSSNFGIDRSTSTPLRHLPLKETHDPMPADSVVLSLSRYK